MFKRKQKKAAGLCTISLNSDGVAFAHARFEDGVQLGCCDFIEADTLASQTEALKDYVEENDLQLCDCALVMRASDYRMYFLDAPNVPDSERALAARFLVKDLIDYPFDQAAIDVFEVPNRPGCPAKVYVVAMKMDRLKELNQFISDIGLSPVCVSVAELALNALTRASAESEAGTAFLYKDMKTLHILLCKAGVLRMVRDVGPVTILEDSSQHERFTLEIQRSLDFYQSQLAELPPVKLYVTPRIAEYESVISLLEGVLTIPVGAYAIEEVLPNYANLEPTQRLRCLPVIGELQRIFHDLNQGEST